MTQIQLLIKNKDETYYKLVGIESKDHSICRLHHTHAHRHSLTHNIHIDCCFKCCTNDASLFACAFLLGSKIFAINISFDKDSI